jgi:hypothetical protein
MFKRGTRVVIVASILAIGACAPAGAARDDGAGHGTNVAAAATETLVVHAAARINVAEPADAPRGPIRSGAAHANVAEPADAPRGPVRSGQAPISGSTVHSVQQPGLSVGDRGGSGVAHPRVNPATPAVALPGINVGDYGGR